MTWKQQQFANNVKSEERWVREPRFFGSDTELVVFPGPYAVGIANLGYQFLLGRLIESGRSFDRLFLDKELPVDVSLDTFRPILDFPRWDITLPFEENLLQLIKLLVKLDLPLEGASRIFPILNIGGAMSFINKDLVKFLANELYCGEADEDWPELRSNDQWKLSKNFGVYSVVASPRSVFKNTALLEIARGCMWNCKFCLYRQAYNRIRFVQKERVLQVIDDLHDKGFGKVGLIAANVSDVPWIGDILRHIDRMGMKVSVSSLAVETLSDEVMFLLRGLGVDQLTLAVEHGDQETRQELGKPFSDEELLATLRKAVEIGFKSVKLYFINGITPDWRFNAENGAALLNKIKSSISMAVKVSASVFVPKPGTAMENDPFPSEKDIDAERKFLRTNCPDIEFSFEPYFEAQKEFVMSRLKVEDLSEFVFLLQKGDRKAIKFFAEKYS
jgi:radical SAM superfamily enzyme YgiQ (UPF0313 family)